MRSWPSPANKNYPPVVKHISALWPRSQIAQMKQCHIYKQHNDKGQILAVLVEANGECSLVDLVQQTPRELFGMRPYDDWGFKARPHDPYSTPHADQKRHGATVLNRSSLIHDPAKHDDAEPRTCIEAWTVTAGELGQGDNALGRVVVKGLPCFLPGALKFCKGRMVFVGWGGRSLVQPEVDKIAVLLHDAGATLMM